jgi:uncharacterized protein YkwD
MSSRSLKGLCAWLLGLALIGPMSSASPAVASVRAPVHCRGSGLQPTFANVEEVEAATLCLIDIRRTSRQRGMLRENTPLSHVALRQVRLMVHRDYFADVGPSGQTPAALVAASTYALGGSFAVGQNLAWGTGGATTPARIVAAWMKSPPHRRIMLDPRYRDAGVGVVPATPAVIGTGQQGATYAIEFGERVR